MKITGPKGPGASEPASPEVAGARKATEAGFDRALGETGSPAASPSSMIDQLGALLKSGELTGPEAIEQLVEEVVRRRAAGLDPHLREKMVEALRSVVADDPILADKMKTLAGEDAR